jgi:hypothetical protein
LRTNEVPVRFLKDPEGRFSHHVRVGWWEPWRAGWINLQAMFVFGADFFLAVPGLVLLALGLVPLCLLAFGPVTIAGVTLSVNSMLLCLVASILGLQMSLIAVVAQSLYDGVGRKRQRWRSIFSYTRTIVAMAILFVAGLVLVLRFVAAFAAQNYALSDSSVSLNHNAIFGLFLMIGSILVFVSMLLLHAVGLYVPIRPPSAKQAS